LYNKKPLNYIIMVAVLVSLTGCDTLFGTKGKPATNSRTASLENRRDEEVFTTSHQVHFESNGVSPDEESMETIKMVADMIVRSQPTLVIVTGYSDTYGPAASNQKISVKRAGAVAKLLQKQGVDSGLIRTEGKGETDLLIPTQDNIKLLDNRRVVIQLQK